VLITTEGLHPTTVGEKAAFLGRSISQLRRSCRYCHVRILSDRILAKESAGQARCRPPAFLARARPFQVSLRKFREGGFFQAALIVLAFFGGLNYGLSEDFTLRCLVAVFAKRGAAGFDRRQAASKAITSVRISSGKKTPSSPDFAISCRIAAGTSKTMAMMRPIHDIFNSSETR
jgi:hypothetical protein